MTEPTLKFIGEQLGKVLTDQRLIREDMRRIMQLQADTSRVLTQMFSELTHLNGRFGSLQEELSLMIRSEIGGLFAHLETRLERRIEALIEEKART